MPHVRYKTVNLFILHCILEHEVFYLSILSVFTYICIYVRIFMESTLKITCDTSGITYYFEILNTCIYVCV